MTCEHKGYVSVVKWVRKSGNLKRNEKRLTKRYKTVFMVKAYSNSKNSYRGYIPFTLITFNKDWVGKKLRLKIEVVGEEYEL